MLTAANPCETETVVHDADLPGHDVSANRLMESQYMVEQSLQDCLSQIRQRLSRPRLAAIDDICLTQALMGHDGHES